MWKVYLTSKTNHCRASELLGITDKWAAYQFDCAVSFVGITIENALQETIKDKSTPKYKLSDLLKPDYKLPKPPTEQQEAKGAISWLKMQAGKGVKVFKVMNKKEVS